MSGGSKKQAVGYWYKPMFHVGLCKGPIDAFLEFRGADKVAWKGAQTASGTISINEPKLWGGEKDQGGIVGDIDLMFGEAAQAPNAYLLATLGDQIPGWRGLMTLVFKGGKFGAMNPNPQPTAYKLRKIKQGWDGGAAWYPEKAEIVMASWLIETRLVDLDAIGNAATGTAGGLAVGVEIVTNNPEIVLSIRPNMDPGAAFVALSFWGVPAASGGNTGSQYPFNVVEDAATDVARGIPGTYDGYVAARQAFIDQVGERVISGASSYVFYIKDSPIGDNSGGLSLEVDLSGRLVAMNPAHALYYSRTNAEMGREPTGNIDAASLTAAADALAAEGFGICTTRDASQESVEEFESRITRLIDGSFSRDPITGLWHLDLARGDYVLGDLPILADDDILEFREIPTALENVTNSVSVTYFDPEIKETITTPPVQATALVAEFGEIHQTLEYLEIPTATLALRVAQRELNARVTPARAYELTCTRRPFAWRPSTYFRLQAPKRGIADLVCLLADKESGSLRSGAIRITATQDIYSMPAVAFAQAEAGVDTSPAQAPVAVAQQAAFEAPYIIVHATLERAEFDALPTDAGYLLTVAADPAVSVNYTLMVDAGAGYAEVAAGDWCPSGMVSAAATRTTTAITITGGTRLGEVLLGSAALWDGEIVRVDAINTGTGAVTIARGCADTVPAEHASGSRIWFFGGNEVFDSTEYTAAETINAKLLTNTGSQQLGIASATAMPVTFAERLARPYPPGNVKIASADWPASVSGSFAVTWAHRNRVLQADQIIDTTAGSITPGDNIRYGLRFRRTDTNAVLVERTDIGPPTATVTLTHTGNVSLELWTVDDSGVSWQSHLHTFSYTPPASPTDTITATAYTPVFGGTIIDGGDLDA